MAGDQGVHTKHTSSSGTATANARSRGSPEPADVTKRDEGPSFPREHYFTAPGDTRGAITKRLAMVDQLNK